MEPLVTVITPIYNGEKTISYTIESVLNQTYKNFEMIIVDDISTDKTREIVERYVKKDKRIKYFLLDEKGGASMARNFALSKAKGEYIAFLDGDDIWHKEKLEKQIKFMQDNNYYFTYTDYEYIDENNNELNIVRKCPKKVTYRRMLLGDSIGCLTVIYDARKVGKIKIEKLDKRNDYAIWCLALKKVKRGYKYNEVLAQYRKNTNSISSGKKYKLLKYHYNLHRNINKFNPITSGFLTVTNTINYILNRVFREKKKKAKYKVAIIGHFALGKEFNDGQTVKTKNIYKTLNKYYENQIFIVDTYKWKKNPIRLFLNCKRAIKNCDNVIFLPAKNGVKVFTPLLTKLNKNKKRNLIYAVIGGWLPDLLNQNPKLVNACQKLSYILVETKGMLKSLEKQGLDNCKILLNFKNINVLDKERISFNYKSAYKLCTFSRVMFEKGITDAIEAVKSVNEFYGKEVFSIDIYGPIDSNYTDEFNKLVEDNKRSVKYKGVVDSYKSVEVVSKYDLLLFPTRFSTEGLPGTIIDAFSAGIPVIYSDWNYCDEFFKNEYNGIKFKMGNVDDLVKVLKGIYDKKYDIKTMKYNCLESAKKYESDNAIKVLLDCLR